MSKELINVAIPSEQLQYSKKPAVTKTIIGIVVFGVIEFLQNEIRGLPENYQILGSAAIAGLTFWAMDRYGYVDWRNFLNRHIVAPTPNPDEIEKGVIQELDSAMNTIGTCDECGENRESCEVCEPFRDNNG